MGPEGVLVVGVAPQRSHLTQPNQGSYRPLVLAPIRLGWCTSDLPLPRKPGRLLVLPVGRHGLYRRQRLTVAKTARCIPDPSAVIFAVEPLRRSLLSLPIFVLRAAARRLREILAENYSIISKHDAQ